jgi:hypothetical protein
MAGSFADVPKEYILASYDVLFMLPLTISQPYATNRTVGGTIRMRHQYTQAHNRALRE